MEQEDDDKEGLVGRAVRKFFKGHGHFQGLVTSYDRATGYFSVKYTDGDKEDLELHELREMLVMTSEVRDEKKQRGRPKNRAKKRKVSERDAMGKCGNEEEALKDKTGLVEENDGGTLTHNVGAIGGISYGDTPPKKKFRCADPSSVRRSSRLRVSSSVERGNRTSGNSHGQVEDVPEVSPCVEVLEKGVREQEVDDDPALREAEKGVREQEAGDGPALREATSDSSGCQARVDGSEVPVSAAVLNIRPLPSSSLKHKLPAHSLVDLFSIYAFLRSFSSTIFLSPFPFDVLVQSLRLKEANSLVDQIHLSLLVVLRKHLENLAKDGVESAAKCLRCRDWKLLDILTWPFYMAAYLLIEGFTNEKQDKISIGSVLKGDYYGLEVCSKISMLSFLCDRLLDTESIRAELGNRTHVEADFEVTPFSKSAFDGDLKYETRSSAKRFESSDDAILPSTPDTRRSSSGGEKDWNNDDCVLCGMDGNLLCCDGCPAAYHSRCVGISKALLPEGDWYCPECSLTRSRNGGGRTSKGLRGYERLGLDFHGRRYMMVADHIFVSESSAIDSSYVCYPQSDISALLEFLDVDGSLPASLRDRLSGVSDGVLNTSSSKAEPLICSVNEAGNEIFISSPKRRTSVKKNESGKQAAGLETIPEPFLYMNHYAWAASAALAASYLAAGTKKREDVGSAQKVQIAEQIKAFSQAPIQFYWPSMKKKQMEAPRDKCGWCFACKQAPVRKRGCLLNIATAKLSAGAALAGSALRPLKKGFNHFWTLAAYILYMEERLNGLLTGPWDSIDHRKQWKKRVERADNIRQVKYALLEFESNLRTLSLSRNWKTCAEEAPGPRWSPSTIPAPRRCGRRKTVVETSELLQDFSWKRGGVTATRFLDWENVPTRVLQRAARQGGVKKIPGLLYTNDVLDLPRRTGQCAWKARVERAATVPELALQVRYLDALIRWGDLSVPQDLVNAFPGCSRDVDHSLICDKSTEGEQVMYLVNSSKTEEDLKGCLSSQVLNSPLKFVETVVGEAAGCKNRVWLLETQVPLCLIKDYEEKHRHCTKSAKITVRRTTSRISKREKFRLVMNKLYAEEVKRLKLLNSLKCQRCTVEMDASLSARCRKCQGVFHAKCLNIVSTDVCDDCFTLNQNKRTPRVKRLAVQNIPLQLKPDTHKETKPLIAYTRRRKDRVAVPSNGPVVFRKKRSKTYVNVTGVQWKRGLDTELTLRKEKLIFPRRQNFVEGPACALCHQLYDSSYLYVGCERCQAWFHGDAIGVTEKNLHKVAAFRCHKCRKKAGPVCPHTKQVDVILESKENESPISENIYLSKTTDLSDEGVSEISN